jgi:hypothetical protein
MLNSCTVTLFTGKLGLVNIFSLPYESFFAATHRFGFSLSRSFPVGRSVSGSPHSNRICPILELNSFSSARRKVPARRDSKRRKQVQLPPSECLESMLGMRQMCTCMHAKHAFTVPLVPSHFLQTPHFALHPASILPLFSQVGYLRNHNQALHPMGAVSPCLESLPRVLGPAAPLHSTQHVHR